MLVTINDKEIFRLGTIRDVLWYEKSNLIQRYLISKKSRIDKQYNSLIWNLASYL